MNNMFKSKKYGSKLYDGAVVNWRKKKRLEKKHKRVIKGLDNFSEWIRYDYDMYKCKKCGCKMIHSLPTKYCPNCGRKMIDVIEKIGEEDD